jgi:hypothetical protein
MSVPSSVAWQAQLGCQRGRRRAVADSYTATRRDAARPFACSPACSDFSALPGRSGRIAASRAECEVQRRVHPHVSRQYQRTSRQALPPSATIWWAGRRMPHIQHDLTGDDSPASAVEGRLVITCSPRSPATRSVVSARAVGLLTVASVRSASFSSAESLILIHPPRATWVSPVPGPCPCPEREYRQGQRGGQPAGSSKSGPCRYQRGPTTTCCTGLPFNAWAHRL